MSKSGSVAAAPKSTTSAEAGGSARGASALAVPSENEQFEANEVDQEALYNAQLQEQIVQHNRLIANLKARIEAIRTTPCPDTVQLQQMGCLHECLRREQQALEATVQLAIQAIADKPDRIAAWTAVPIQIETTLEEDRQQPQMMFNPRKLVGAVKRPGTPVMGGEPITSLATIKKEPGSSSAEAGGSKTATGSATPGEGDTGTNLGEEKAAEEDAEAEVRCRDMLIDCIQQKMDNIRDEMQALCQHTTTSCGASTGGATCPAHIRRSKIAALRRNQPKRRPCSAAKTMQADAHQAAGMQSQLEQMERVLHKLQHELYGVGGTEMMPELASLTLEPPSNALKCDEASELKNQHNTLLSEYAKKSDECRKLRTQLACTLQAAQSPQVACETTTAEAAQILVLQARIAALCEERGDQQQLCAEHQQQMDEYRQKFLCAQQQVCEQRAALTEAQEGREHIKRQIDDEVKRITDRFQCKLRELAPMPQLLQQERFAVEQLRQRCSDVEAQLCNAQAQLRKAVKDLKRQDGCKEGGSDREAMQEAMRKLREQTEREVKALQEQLATCRKEMEEQRVEGEQKLQRAARRAEGCRLALQKRIDKLEVELVETRANAALKLAGRDDQIGAMRRQLTEVASNFGTAQRQIVGLKRRMAEGGSMAAEKGCS